jgi:hypothetical protein
MLSAMAEIRAALCFAMYLRPQQLNVSILRCGGDGGVRVDMFEIDDSSRDTACDC